jgi:hypothetical protein
MSGLNHWVVSRRTRGWHGKTVVPAAIVRSHTLTRPPPRNLPTVSAGERVEPLESFARRNLLPGAGHRPCPLLGVSGHHDFRAQCLLLTQSGHGRVDFAVLHKTAALQKRCGRLLSSA